MTISLRAAFDALADALPEVNGTYQYEPPRALGIGLRPLEEVTA